MWEVNREGRRSRKGIKRKRRKRERVRDMDKTTEWESDRNKEGKNR